MARTKGGRGREGEEGRERKGGRGRKGGRKEAVLQREFGNWIENVAQ